MIILIFVEIEDVLGSLNYCLFGFCFCFCYSMQSSLIVLDKWLNYQQFTKAFWCFGLGFKVVLDIVFGRDDKNLFLSLFVVGHVEFKSNPYLGWATRMASELKRGHVFFLIDFCNWDFAAMAVLLLHFASSHYISEPS